MPYLAAKSSKCSRGCPVRFDPDQLQFVRIVANHPLGASQAGKHPVFAWEEEKCPPGLEDNPGHDRDTGMGNDGNPGHEDSDRE